MIAYLEGKIILKTEKFIILDVRGVGYKVFLSQKTLSKLPEIGKNLNPHTKQGQPAEGGKIDEVSPCYGVKVKTFCFLNIRENAMDLYGFLDYKELEFFEILEGIRGVGPKASLEISSLGPLEKIRERIISQDEKLFERIPGIGRKKAMTIILELSGKIKEILKKEKTPKSDEAEEALIGLGFSHQKAREALTKIPKGIESTEQRIKEALKILGK